MNSTELEQKTIVRFGTKNEGKKFIKAVRERFKDREILDMKPGVVYTVNGIYAYSSFTNNWYKLDVEGK